MSSFIPKITQHDGEGLMFTIQPNEEFLLSMSNELNIEHRLNFEPIDIVDGEVSYVMGKNLSLEIGLPIFGDITPPNILYPEDGYSGELPGAFVAVIENLGTNRDVTKSELIVSRKDDMSDGTVFTGDSSDYTKITVMLDSTFNGINYLQAKYYLKNGIIVNSKKAKIDVRIISKPKTVEELANLINLGKSASEIDTSLLTSLDYFWCRLKRKDKLQGMGNWNTSNVTSAVCVFGYPDEVWNPDYTGPNELKDLGYSDIHNYLNVLKPFDWDLSKVKDMSFALKDAIGYKIFGQHSKFTFLNLESCVKAKGMYMFSDNMINIPNDSPIASYINLIPDYMILMPNVTDISYMFYGSGRNGNSCKRVIDKRYLPKGDYDIPLIAHNLNNVDCSFLFAKSNIVLNRDTRFFTHIFSTFNSISNCESMFELALIDTVQGYGITDEYIAKTANKCKRLFYKFCYKNWSTPTSAIIGIKFDEIRGDCSLMFARCEPESDFLTEDMMLAIRYNDCKLRRWYNSTITKNYADILYGAYAFTSWEGVLGEFDFFRTNVNGYCYNINYMYAGLQDGYTSPLGGSHTELNLHDLYFKCRELIGVFKGASIGGGSGNDTYLAIDFGWMLDCDDVDNYNLYPVEDLSYFLGDYFVPHQVGGKYENLCVGYFGFSKPAQSYYGGRNTVYRHNLDKLFQTNKMDNVESLKWAFCNLDLTNSQPNITFGSWLHDMEGIFCMSRNFNKGTYYYSKTGYSINYSYAFCGMGVDQIPTMFFDLIADRAPSGLDFTFAGHPVFRYDPLYTSEFGGQNTNRKIKIEIDTISDYRGTIELDKILIGRCDIIRQNYRAGKGTFLALRDSSFVDTGIQITTQTDWHHDVKDITAMFMYCNFYAASSTVFNRILSGKYTKNFFSAVHTDWCFCRGTVYTLDVSKMIFDADKSTTITASYMFSSTLQLGSGLSKLSYTLKDASYMFYNNKFIAEDFSNTGHGFRGAVGEGCFNGCPNMRTEWIPYGFCNDR